MTCFQAINRGIGPQQAIPVVLPDTRVGIFLCLRAGDVFQDALAPALRLAAPYRARWSSVWVGAVKKTAGVQEIRVFHA
jgi:hypothetical protein